MYVIKKFRNYFFVPTDNAHESVATTGQCERPIIIDTALYFWGLVVEFFFSFFRASLTAW